MPCPCTKNIPKLIQIDNAVQKLVKTKQVFSLGDIVRHIKSDTGVMYDRQSVWVQVDQMALVKYLQVSKKVPGKSRFEAGPEFDPEPYEAVTDVLKIVDDPTKKQAITL